VNAYGGTAENRAEALDSARGILTRTDRGKVMLETLQSRTERQWYCAWLCKTTKPFDIVLTNTGGSYANFNDDYIMLSLRQVGMRNEQILPGGSFTYTRIEAHEFGHAILGSQNEWANVQLNENPIMRQLGDPYTRTGY
jgi:hypothetical protein